MRAGRLASGPRAEKVNYIAMELVDGASLADIIHDAKKHRTDLKTMLGYLAQSSDGLAKAHASGIVHRDLKPGNIMVTKDGYAKVLDFGLAKLVEKEAAPATININTKQALTVEGMIVGTIGYMAPEQILGRPVDHRSDIFAFGCILYEAITRQRPFKADSQFEALQKIIHEHPAPIESIVPDLPIELRQLVARCLAKAPDDRVPGMKDVATGLRRIANSCTTCWRRPPRGPATRPRSIRRSRGRSAATRVDRERLRRVSVHRGPGRARTPAGAMPSGVAPSRRSSCPRRRAADRRDRGVAVVVLALAGFLVYKFALGTKGGGGLSDEALSKMTISPVLSNELLQASPFLQTDDTRPTSHWQTRNGSCRCGKSRPGRTPSGSSAG